MTRSHLVASSLLVSLSLLPAAHAALVVDTLPYRNTPDWTDTVFANTSMILSPDGSNTTLSTAPGEGVWFGWGASYADPAPAWTPGDSAAGNYLLLDTSFSPGAADWSAYFYDRSDTAAISFGSTGCLDNCYGLPAEAGVRVWHADAAGATTSTFVPLDLSVGHRYEVLLKDSHVTYHVDGNLVQSSTAMRAPLGSPLIVIGDGSATNRTGSGIMQISRVAWDNAPTLETFSGQAKANSGSFNNPFGSTFGIGGALQNLAGGIFGNAGQVDVSGSGRLLNAGSVNNLFGGFMGNAGTLTNGALGGGASASFTNTGTLNNLFGGLAQNHATMNNAVGGLVGNTGSFNNLLGGQFQNHGTVNNLFGGLMGNAGTLTNGVLGGGATASFTNAGTLNNLFGGLARNHATMNNAVGGFMGNAGTFNNLLGGQFQNHGTVNNLFGGFMGNAGTLTNGVLGGGATASFTNAGTLNNLFGGLARNHATMNNAVGGFMGNAGTFNNLLGGQFQNHGTVNNLFGGFMGNAGTLTNGALGGGATASFTNTGSFNNLFGGLAQNHATMNNAVGGLMGNAGNFNNLLGGQFENRGTVNNVAGGLVANAGSMFNALGGGFQNDGTLNNLLGGSFSNRGRFTNTSSNTVNNDGLFSVDGTLENTASGTFNNNATGLLEILAGGTLGNDGLIANDGRLTNAGQVDLGLTGRIQGDGSYTQTAGGTHLLGRLAGDAIRFEGGSLSGTGTVAGTQPIVVGADATLFPGGAVTGVLTFDGGLELAGDIYLELSRGGGVAAFDTLSVLNGSLRLFDTTDIFLDFGFLPVVGDAFALFHADAFVGLDLARWHLAGAGGAAYRVGEESGRVVLRFLPSVAGVPEPATWALLLAPMAVLGMRGMGRRGRPGTSAHWA